jgi:hypothetical protein
MVPGLKLRMKSPEQAELLANVNGDLLAHCSQALTSHNYVLWEEALIRTQHRRNRSLTQWYAIGEALAQHFHQPLLRVDKKFLRDAISTKFDRPLRVLGEAVKELHRGHGNEKAGWCFAYWRQELTKREVDTRHKIARGFDNSAEQIQAAADKPPQLEKPADG